MTIATNMAGRGTDILLGGNPEALARAEVDFRHPEVETAFAQAMDKFKSQCAREKDEVLKAGGLHILGTERHESRRIDNQLRGRAGRQGDPGSSRFYISLEDDLMRIFGGERISGLMERLGMKDGEVIEHPWVNKSIENAQRRVEGHNFDVRKHLLEYDDVMNDQRGAVYKLRRRAIGGDAAATREMLLDLMEDVVINIVGRACPERANVDEWDIKGLEEMVREQFGEVALKLDHDITREAIENKVFEAVEHALKEREERFGKDAFFHVARIIYLQTIDNLWKDHLREMDQLREGISLRGYAQKDPKQEYKKEGFNLFANMMATIAADVLQKVFRVVITSETEDEYQARLKAQRDRQAKLMREGTGPDPSAANSKSPGESAKQETVRRSTAKVGANDPCPCGSGKKYKKCHMNKDELNV